MSKRVYSQNTLDIQERFFNAYDLCKEKKLLPFTTIDFAKMVGTYAPHFYEQRKDRSKGFFEPSWLVPLVKDCGVSAHWLLTGQGMMFAL